MIGTLEAHSRPTQSTSFPSCCVALTCNHSCLKLPGARIIGVHLLAWLLKTFCSTGEEVYVSQSSVLLVMSASTLASFLILFVQFPENVRQIRGQMGCGLCCLAVWESVSLSADNQLSTHRYPPLYLQNYAKISCSPQRRLYSGRQIDKKLCD